MTYAEALAAAPVCPVCSGSTGDPPGHCDECAGHGRLIATRCTTCNTVTPLRDADMWCPCGGNWERGDTYFVEADR